jgi:DNA-binding NarL/FixJ family response regulator
VAEFLRHLALCSLGFAVRGARVWPRFLSSHRAARRAGPDFASGRKDLVNLAILSARPAIAAGLSRCLSIKFGPVTVWTATPSAATPGRVALESLPPSADVVIIDSIGLHGALRTIRRSARNDAIRILILVSQPSDYLSERCRQAGANALLSEQDDLPAWDFALSRIALHTFHAGPSFIDAPRIIPLLTLRQREVYECVIRGMTDEATALRLAISIDTAETHRRDLMKKLNCHSHQEVVMHAVRLGIIAPSDVQTNASHRQATRRHSITV